MSKLTAIIGGGPSGLSACLALSRVRRPNIVFDSGVYRNSPASHAHTIYGLDGASNPELRETARSQIRQYGNTEFVDEAVVDIERKPDGFFLFHTATGKKFDNISKIIFATGIKDILPNIPGLQELWNGGRCVHCVFCHGWEVRDKKLAFVVANGNLAAKGLKMASTISKDITVLSNGPFHGDDNKESDGPSLREQLFPESSSNNLIETKIKSFHLDPNVSSGNEMDKEDIVITFDDGSTKSVGGVLLIPNSEVHPDVKNLLEKLNIKVKKMTPIPGFDNELVEPIDASQHTNDPDISVAGDLSTVHRNIPFAVNSGVTAGAVLHEAL